MPSIAERSRNNVRAGLFVTITLILAFAVVVVLTDLLSKFGARDNYTLIFTIGSGVEGITEGSQVRLGGLPVGRVLKVQPRQTGGTVSDIEVDFEIESDITLYKDARALRAAPLLGNIAAINFISIGTPAAGVLPPGGTLEASAGGGLLAALLGNPATAANLTTNISDFGAFLGNIDTEYEKRVVPIFDRANEFMVDARDIAGSVKADYAQWRETINQVLAKVNDAADKLDAALTEGKVAIGDARALIVDNRPKVDEIVENVRVASADLPQITSHVREKTLAEVDRLLARGGAAVESFQSTMLQVQQWVTAEIPGIHQMLADLRLTAGQLKLTAIEVRRAPWLLLYNPSEQEWRHEILYDSARSFAMAASDLKAASESMQRLVDLRPQGLAPEQQQAFQQFYDNLQRSFQNYQQTQERLLNVLIERGPDAR